jgi:heme/copper-type cytochrome/quinol oxidase subunit 1
LGGDRSVINISCNFKLTSPNGLTGQADGILMPRLTPSPGRCLQCKLTHSDMRNRYRNTLTELVWLAAACVFSLLLAVLLFGQKVFNNSFDYHLHDTYFVLSNWKVLLSLFLFITFFIYFIKDFAQKFTRKFANWILVLTGILSLFVLNEAIKFFSIFAFNWTIYPPLSSLGGNDGSHIHENDFVHNVLSLLPAITSKVKHQCQMTIQLM